MKILLTRNSVCMADDLEPHDAQFDIHAESLEDVLEWIQTSGYLPKVGGGLTSWSAVSNIPLAVYAAQWDKPKPVLFNTWMHMKKLRFDGDVLKIHFNHHYALDPELVVKVLQQYGTGL